MDKLKGDQMINKKLDPIDKSKEFAHAILESNEYKSFISASNNLEKNEESNVLIKKFQEKQMEFRRSNFNPSLMDELRELQLKINQNKTILQFSKTQEELVKLLKRTNNIIRTKIGMQFAQGRSGGGC